MGSAARPSAWTPWSLGGDLFKGGASQKPTVCTKRYDWASSEVLHAELPRDYHGTTTRPARGAIQREMRSRSHRDISAGTTRSGVRRCRTNGRNALCEVSCSKPLGWSRGLGRQTVRDRTTGRTSFVKPTGSSNFFASSKLEAARSSSKLCGAARSRRTSARNASRSLHPRTDRADGNPGNAERSPCALPTGSTARCSVDRIVRLVSHHGRCLCTALQSAADGDATRR